MDINREGLRNIVERIERLESDKASVAVDIREVYGEAKALGYDKKIIRKVVQLRKLSPAERAEQEELVDLYMHAVDRQGDFFKDETTVTLSAPGKGLRRGKSPELVN